MEKKGRLWLAAAIVAAGFLAGFLPARATAADICRTPDGFSFDAMSPNAISPPQPSPRPGHGTPDGNPDDKGIGGTGHAPLGGTPDKTANGKGIGGTGIDLADDKGIGGTGVSRDGAIAIVGRITGFGSICVNGIEVHYPAALPVQDGADRKTASDLKVGQMVSVLAEENAGRFTARRIQLDHILSGTLDSVDHARRALVINGQRVVLGGNSRMPTFAPGETISVAGFRDAHGQVVATLLERGAAARSPAAMPAFNGASRVALQGYLSKGGTSGEIIVGGTKVNVPDSVRVTGGDRRDLSGQERVIVFAHRDGGSLRADIVAIEHQPLDATVADARDTHDRQKSTGERRDGDSKAGDSGKNQDDGKNSGGGDRQGSDNHGNDGHGGDSHGEDSHGGHDRPDIPDSGKPEIEKPDVEKPEVEKPEVDKPEVEKPEIEKPEVDKPEIEKPEIETPEIEKPE